MTDAWDEMIAGSDAEVQAEIKADAIAYATYILSEDAAGATAIEQKYGLYGLSPQQVSEQLCEMSKPMSGGAA